MLTKKYRAWELPREAGETDEQLTSRRNHRYYEEQLADNISWWNRIDYSGDLKGKRVLEIGCGHGALSVNALERGAIKVLGIDLDQERIDFANAKIRSNPALVNNVSFLAADLSQIEDGSFDVCLSKE